MSINGRNKLQTDNHKVLRERTQRNHDAHFIASQTGTEYKQMSETRSDYDYDYKEVNRKPTIGGPFGVRELVCTKRDDGTFDRS